MFRLSLSFWLCASLLLAGRVSLGQISAQAPQTSVQTAGARVTAIVPGVLQPVLGRPGLLYVTAAAGRGADVSVTAGLLLNDQGFTDAESQKITFHDVRGASAALAHLDQDERTDLVFGLAPLRAADPNFCVFSGTGGSSPDPLFLAEGRLSGCVRLPGGGQPPDFAWIAVAPFRTGALDQVFLVDRANGLIYVVENNGSVVENNGSPAGTGVLTGFSVRGMIPTPRPDGAGPIYAVDLNGDGKTDLIVNNQGNSSITFYAGKGDGSFQTPIQRLAGQARSMLLHDMDGDGITDLVTEDPAGGIRIFRGTNGSGFPFEESAGGTVSGGSGGAGSEGRLAAIGDLNHDGIPDILLTSPLGVQVMEGEPGMRFAPKGVYPAGTERSPVVLGEFDGSGDLSLAIGSGNGVATLRGNGDGSFQSATLHEVWSGHEVAAGALETHTSLRSQDLRPEVTPIGTTTSLALCVGPGASCPITSIVVPPYVPALTMFFGQEFNGSASASSADGSVLDPASTIAFTDSLNGAAPVTLCTLGILYGSTCPPAVGTTIGTAVGTHAFLAVYSGDATHTGSTSAPVTLTVVPDLITSYTLVASANPSPAGQPVVFTATLKGNYAAPNGTYPVLDGGTAIGTITLSPGAGINTSTGTFTAATLTPGTHTISAPYPGNVNFQAAASPVILEVINPPAATVSHLVSSGSPSVAGQAVTFTDTVSVNVTGTGVIPAGTVTFLDRGTVLGTAQLSASGVATFTTAGLAAGSHTITATSSENAVSAASSATVVQVVTALPAQGSVNFSVTVTPSPVPLGVGNFAALTVRVAPVASGFPEAVKLSCSGLPYQSACMFTNALIPAGGGTTTLLVSSTAPHSCGSSAPYFIAQDGAGPMGHGSLIVPGLAGLLSLGVPGRRRWMRALVALLMVAGAVQISGCGTCTDLGTRPGTYTIQVNGASAVTPEVEGTAVTLHVHL